MLIVLIWVIITLLIIIRGGLLLLVPLKLAFLGGGPPSEIEMHVA
jgi:hypothetical protein